VSGPAWWSQPYAPEGSQAGEGVSNQLGRPALDPLEILVREAAQNSWDAHRPDRHVTFRVSLQRLGDRASAWQRRIQPVPAVESVDGLAESLTPDSMVWVISDRGTYGLGGPIRAGEQAEPGQRSDFVQFMRNVGEPRDLELGGGTFGFGKGIFYRLSRPGVIVASSRASDSPEDRRVMGAAIGRSFYVDRRRYTGRHWWGAVNDNVPDPVIGAEGDVVASELGLPAFAQGETGTDIVVVGASLGWESAEQARTPAEAGTFVASAILWHLWPKMVGDQARRMSFSVDVEGVEIPIPDPGTVDALAPFVDALLAVRAHSGTEVTRTVAPQNIGRFAIEVNAVAPETVPESAVVKAAMPIETPLHHVARMRQVELVVDYREGPLHPNPSLQYGGVFQASKEADSHFAAAEPPTHDDWVEKGLVGTDRGVLQKARLDLQRYLFSKFEQPMATANTERVGLGALSARLGSMLNGVGELPSGGHGGGGGGGGGGAGRTPAIRIVDPLRLQLGPEGPFLVARVRLAASDESRTFHAEAVVKLDGGGTEGAAPVGAPTPTILSWVPVAGGDQVAGADLQLGPSDDSDWWVYSSFVPLAVVEIVVRKVA
jgi:hypothetical protein